MTTVETIAAEVHEWAKANKDALPEWPHRVAGGRLDDGTVVAVTFTPEAFYWGKRVEQRPVLVYRLQRDGVYAVTPFTVEAAARDGIGTVQFVHRSTERYLEKMRQRHA
jgi:hypothetical protein